MPNQQRLVYGNFPTADPDYKNKGKAWQIPLSASDNPAHSANIANWLVCAEGFNPYAVGWWYVVMLAHLRPIEGVEEPAHLRFPDATHEVIFATLNPAKPLPTLGKWEFVDPLQPFDLVHQFMVRSDDQAKTVIEMVVEHICDGQSPDQDNRQYWEVCINNTAEHIMYDGHPSRN